MKKKKIHLIIPSGIITITVIGIIIIPVVILNEYINNS